MRENNPIPASGKEPSTGVGISKRLILVAATLIALYAATLIFLAPLSPFEWDEVLFQRALDRYDVAAYSPHPPGYPVYVGAARVARLIVKNPLWALQAVSILATLLIASLPCLLAWLRVLPWSVAAMSAVLTATIPAVAFNAAVGLSDITGAALGISALILIGASLHLDQNRRVWPPEAAAVVTAVTLGVRPQLAMLLGIPWLWLLVSLARDRRWGPIIRSVLLVVGVSAAIWIPAIAATGLERYLDVVEVQREWMAVHEQGYRLPGASDEDQAPRARLVLRPYQELTIDRLLPSLFALDGIAAVAVTDPGGNIGVQLEVIRQTASAEHRVSVPVLDTAVFDRVGPWSFDLSPPTEWSTSDFNLAVTAPSDRPVEASILLRGSKGSMEIPLSMAARSFELLEIDYSSLVGGRESIRATVTASMPGDRIVVSATAVDHESGAVSIAVSPR